MKTAKQYLKEDMGIEMPKCEITGQWFADNGLPMIVSCSCCGSTLALPFAWVGKDGEVYCSQCAG